MAAAFEIERFLAAERGKDLLRFSTAGSVDDGKSTLIGRLLYDSGQVYEDHVRSVEGKGTAAPGVPDLALLTDGLRAEREAGITIDVAYRYFSTPRRKFILADTPGHEEYTRNMVTGASTADAVIVLVDAVRGVLPQTRRHAWIAALLGVRSLVLAVNKMDRVSYAEARFEEIRQAFAQFFSEVDGHERIALHAIPVSALTGDQVVRRSEKMPWFEGPTLLGLLDELPAMQASMAEAPFRMAVQRVVRPDAAFRGYAGQMVSGSVRPGDRVTVWPSGRGSRIARLVDFAGDQAEARAPQSITVTLEDELDVSRGDVLASADAPPEVLSAFQASLVWMNETALECGRRYLLMHLARTVPARVASLDHRMAVTGEEQPGATTLRMNEAGLVRIETQQPLVLEAYAENRSMGSFVLIDPETHATVAAGMVRSLAPLPSRNPQPTASSRVQGVSAEERMRRFGHAGGIVTLSGSVAYAESLERALFVEGANVVLLPTSLQSGEQSSEQFDAQAELLAGAGMLVLRLTEQTSADGGVLTLNGLAPPPGTLPPGTLLPEQGTAARMLLHLLQTAASRSPAHFPNEEGASNTLDR